MNHARVVPTALPTLPQLIGHTPLVELDVERLTGESLACRVLAKLEYFNPGKSVKDRVALAMIEDAEASGRIEAGKTTLIEPTSGNTGIALAYLAATKGYRLILTMPETMSLERRRLLVAYGAELVLTEGGRGMRGAIQKAQELQASIPNSVILDQFANPANPAMHEATTALELWEQTEGQIDAVVAGVGTGGTITGIARALKRLKPSFKAIAVEPSCSAILSGGQAGPHKIQGIGAGFIPATLDVSLLDAISSVSDDDALATARQLGKRLGLLSGISGGAAVHAALRLARHPDYAGKTVVAIIASFGERYLSSALFSDLA